MEDTTIKINIESKLMNLPILRKTIRGICSCVIESEQVFQDIDLGLNEALSNVIHHAYENQPGQEIEIVVTICPREFVFQIIDKGLANHQGTKTINTKDNEQEINLDDIESLAESGRGLFLINQVMDEVTYRREKDKNILTLRKSFTPS